MSELENSFIVKKNLIEELSKQPFLIKVIAGTKRITTEDQLGDFIGDKLFEFYKSKFEISSEFELKLKLIILNLVKEEKIFSQQITETIIAVSIKNNVIEKYQLNEETKERIGFEQKQSLIALRVTLVALVVSIIFNILNLFLD